ncbi:hypothetical protein F4802DRAFT_586385 [Xylaria palmicola]|nr:hypothetical protein F4802DRAFT_586385 [Xylaria palmicola]
MAEMMGYWYLSLSVILLLCRFARGTTECTECISLNDLTAHAHGISLSLHGISSAVSFHNGSARSTASLEPTAAYVNLLERWRIESAGGGLEDPWPDGFMFEPRRESWLAGLVPPRLRNLWSSGRAVDTETSISGDAALLCEMLRALQTRNTVPPMRSVGFSVPIWTTDTQAQDIFAAATCANLTVRDMIHEAAATAASQGIDICRVPSDYLPCGSMHIMTLDLNKEVLIASFHAIYRGWYLWQPRRYDVYPHVGRMLDDTNTNSNGDEARTEQEIVDWINEFAIDRPVHKLYLIGPLADNSVLQRAIARSRIGQQLTDIHGYASDEVVSVGAAILVKESMESQGTDCIEPPRCERIREEADRLAGDLHGGHTEL